MGETFYKELIKDMTWSYSRITCFEDCPYKWFLKYIKEYDEAPLFYSSYGSFMHELIGKYYSQQITKEEMLSEFLFSFKDKVLGERPGGNITANYIEAGKQYIKSIKWLECAPVDVEREYRFDINGSKFIGFIDYLGENHKDLYIVDHKSRNLSPRTNRKNQTAKDKELDKMLRQLYLYSAAVKQKHGYFPKYLCFNCFKNGVFIKEQFDEDKYNETIEWATKTIHEIENTTEFLPNINYFNCRFLCGLKDECCYWNGGGYSETRRHK